MRKKRVTYKQSGVDIDKANKFVGLIGRLAKKTLHPSVLKACGGFGSYYCLDIKKYKNPVLVSSSDGVGTKLMIANLVNKHDTVGVDLVGMNVNDILCSGARPLFFLDYMACGRLQPKVLKGVMKGIVEGCKQAGCALIGGETAEMPGIYKDNDYDLAGFSVGVVEKNKIIDGTKIQENDKVIGLASNGLHSNGFSMVRKVLSLKQQKSLSGELLKPTKIYVKPVSRLMERFSVKGIAHITGGAFYEKLVKIIPSGKCCVIDRSSWPVPEIFQIIKRKGNIATKEMYTTFNMGIGMVLIVRAKDSKNVQNFLTKQKIKSWEIGKIVKGGQQRISL